MSYSNLSIQAKGSENCFSIKEREERKGPLLLQDHPILKQEYLETYEQALSYSKLKLYEQVSHRNVKIYEHQYIHQIFTINSPSLPHLVFLHGYGGNSMTGVRIFNELFHDFQIHALDLYGFGYSSRGNFSEDFDFEETKSYFINAIEEWRKEIQIEAFYLVGHSFGGYIAASYAERYPERISRLFLVSPAGTSGFDQNNQEISCTKKFFLRIVNFIFNMKVKPSSAMKNWIFGEKLLDHIVSKMLKLPEDEALVCKRFIKQFTAQENSSEAGFYKIFEWPLKPKVSIEQILNKNKFTFKIDFFFGDEDWMNSENAISLSEKHENVSFTTIKKSGHQINFDNPKDLCAIIIAKSLEKQNAQHAEKGNENKQEKQGYEGNEGNEEQEEKQGKQIKRREQEGNENEMRRKE